MKQEKVVVDLAKRAAHLGLLPLFEKMEEVARLGGLYITARAINNAKNASGWEVSGDLEEAGAAARGERPMESRARGR